MQKKELQPRFLENSRIKHKLKSDLQLLFLIQWPCPKIPKKKLTDNFQSLWHKQNLFHLKLMNTWAWFFIDVPEYDHLLRIQIEFSEWTFFVANFLFYIFHKYKNQFLSHYVTHLMNVVSCIVLLHTLNIFKWIYLFTTFLIGIYLNRTKMEFLEFLLNIITNK